jgi:hypothetical protein
MERIADAQGYHAQIVAALKAVDVSMTRFSPGQVDVEWRLGERDEHLPPWLRGSPQHLLMHAWTAIERLQDAETAAIEEHGHAADDLKRRIADHEEQIERLRREVRERELQRDHSRYLYLREIAYGEAAMMRDEARMRGWVLDIPDTAPAEPMRDA